MNPYEQLLKDAENLFSYTQGLRRDFHRHPELGFKEFRTARVVTKELTELGLEVTSGVGQTGVVALIEGNLPGPVVLLRFDMDALPIEEQTGTEYASENTGVMHACGHDGHIAIGVTVAKLLSGHRDDIHGKIKLLFQPAEEGQGGAQAVLRDGVLENPKVDVALGLHLWNGLALGSAGLIAGPLMAGSDIFSIKITGKGGHGGMPETTLDPIVAAAQIVTAIQSIPARSISALSAAVISVTQVIAGTAYNVIPQEAILNGTIRFFDKDAHAVVLERLEAIVKNIAVAMGCQASLNVEQLTPPVVNAAPIAEIVANAGLQIQPQMNLNKNYRTMVSEDMAYLLEQVPGCFFFVGSANAERGLNFGHHHPKFDIDESALPIGAAWISAAAIDLGRSL